MDNFVLIINGYKLYVYEMVTEDKAELFKIRGHDYDEIDLDDLEYSIERLRRYLLDSLNYRDFSSVKFTVIYNNIDTKVLKTLSEYFLPCRDWQIHKLEDILPTLLLKADKVKVGEEKIVSIEENTWLVEITKEKSILEEIDQKSEIELKADDIPVALYANYSFTTDMEEVNILKKQLESLKDKSNKEIARKNKEIKDLKYKLKEKQDYIDKLNEDTFIYEREIIRVDDPNKNRNWNFSLKQLNISWTSFNKTKVLKGDKIAKIKAVYSKGKWTTKKEANLKSKGRGCLFKLVDDGTRLKDGQVIGVISDKRDNIKNIKDWLKDNEIDF